MPEVQQRKRQVGEAEKLRLLVVDSEGDERTSSACIQGAVCRLDESRRFALPDEARRAIARIMGRSLDQVRPAAPWVVGTFESIVQQQMQSGIL